MDILKSITNFGKKVGSKIAETPVETVETIGGVLGLIGAIIFVHVGLKTPDVGMVVPTDDSDEDPVKEDSCEVDDVKKSEVSDE